MEQDKHIKQILSNSAEAASSNFTDGVLKHVTNLSAVRKYNQALVPQKWERLFVFVFGFTLAAILLLCLLIAATHVDLMNWMRRKELFEIDYNKLVMFIVCFWIVFAANAVLAKKFRPA